MDRSLDEIISERPVRQSNAHHIVAAWLTYHSSAVAAAAAAVDVDPTDALLPEDLAETTAETKAPETALER